MGGGELLPFLTVTITESLWMRASPKRLACSGKCCSSPLRRKPKLTSRSLGITGMTFFTQPMILMCLIFMFQTEEAHPVDLFDHLTFIHSTSLSERIQVAWKEGTAPGVAHHPPSHSPYVHSVEDMTWTYTFQCVCLQCEAIHAGKPLNICKYTTGRSI